VKIFNITDPRLLAVAEAVRRGAVAADIGADHGHLICHLVGEGICPLGYACDAAPKPLSRAGERVKLLGLQDKIETRLTDGLRGLPLGHITDIIIAGMGGELIARIIGDCPGSYNPELRFILQPMTKAERLRTALCRMGFFILKERGVAAGGFLYPVMTVAYDGVRREPDELYAWTGLLPQSGHPDSAALLAKTRDRLRLAAGGLAKSGRAGLGNNEKAGRYAALAMEIDTLNLLHN